MASGLNKRFLRKQSRAMPGFLIYPIKSNGYKITNKINMLYIIDFIGYLYSRFGGQNSER
jgi:hypothetical protein